MIITNHPDHKQRSMTLSVLKFLYAFHNQFSLNHFEPLSFWHIWSEISGNRVTPLLTVTGCMFKWYLLVFCKDNFSLILTRFLKPASHFLTTVYGFPAVLYCFVKLHSDRIRSRGQTPQGCMMVGGEGGWSRLPGVCLCVLNTTAEKQPGNNLFLWLTNFI